MTRTIILALATTALLTHGASAGDTKILTYAEFEPSVTHLDLETCPEAVERRDVFCRLAIGHDAVHVYVFAEDGENALVDMVSYESGEYDIVLK